MNMTINRLFLFLSIWMLTITCISCSQKIQVSSIIHHARIYTVDKNFSTAEAMAIKEGRIIETGSNDFILNKYAADSNIDIQGKTIFPGFIDAHCHFTGYATDRWKCELTGTSSFDQVIEKIKTYAKDAPMTWIYGRGWDQNDWVIKSYPDKRQLDSLFPDRPVYLKRIDGHAAVANQKALNLAGITIGSVITGGEIEIKDGKLTGMLIDNAMNLVEKVIPPISDVLASKYFGELQQACFAVGLTGVHDCGVSEHTVELVDKEQQAGRMKMKWFALLTDSAQYYDKWISKGRYKTDRLQVGGFKIYADGALGSRGACLKKDYADMPGHRGFLLSDSLHFLSVAQKLKSSGLQMCTHAIGDSGNRTILKTYASMLKPGNDLRWRIEHAQVVTPEDIHYFGDNNIIPSVQPTHATSDMYWAESRLGKDRMKGAYAYQSLLKQNKWMPLGTDFPVEDISPFKTFYAAVFRKDAKGYPAGGFQMEEALTREEAIRGMTEWAARAAFEEKEKGSLAAGKAADFIILDRDLMTCPESEVLQTKVLGTYIFGEKVY